MNRKHNLWIVGSIVICLWSCQHQSSQSYQISKKETPAVLNDDNLELKSFGRNRGDMVENLYQDLVDKNPELKALEKELEDFSSKPKDLKEKFENYKGKSENYYSSAHSQLAEIKDSVLRSKLLVILDKSQNAYTHKNKEQEELLQDLNKEHITLNEHYIALKVLLTLPIIEQYQKDHRLDNVEFKSLFKEEKSILQHIDKTNQKKLNLNK